MNTESFTIQSDASSTTSDTHIDSLAHEFTRIHIEKARPLSILSNTFNKGGEEGVLLWLGCQGADTAIYAMDICRHFGLTPGRVANIVKKLEERNYISRREDPDDQRRSMICLTQEGREHAKFLLHQMESYHRQIIQMIGKNHAVHCKEVMEELLSRIETDMFPEIPC